MIPVHVAVLAHVDSTGSLIGSLVSGMPVWQNFFTWHMHCARERYGEAIYPFANGPYGTVILTLAGGGFGHTDQDGFFGVGTPSGAVDVVVFGWEQADLDRDVALAETNGCHVVRTVRASDNEVVDF